MIDIKGLKKSYGENVVLSNCNETFKTNHVSLILGANGSGKTTFAKCLSGLETYSGSINFDGKNISDANKELLVVWDDCPFYENLSGLDNLYILSDCIMSRKEIENIGCERIGKDLLTKKVKKYSYGQKKKLTLCLVEILKPKYLMMDEISNGLDVDAISDLKKEIKKWSGKMTMILTGHQLGFYEDIVQDVYFLKQGNLKLICEDYHSGERRLEDIYEEWH